MPPGGGVHSIGNPGRISSYRRGSALPKWWSATQPGVVLRLLSGEDIGEVSWQVRVAPPEPEALEALGRVSPATVAQCPTGPLKEECIHLHDFETLEEARELIAACIERYNNGWLLQRHGYMTPARAREKLSRRAALLGGPSPCPRTGCGTPGAWAELIATFRGVGR